MNSKFGKFDDNEIKPLSFINNNIFVLFVKLFIWYLFVVIYYYLLLFIIIYCYL